VTLPAGPRSSTFGTAPNLGTVGDVVAKLRNLLKVDAPAADVRTAVMREDCDGLPALNYLDGTSCDEVLDGQIVLANPQTNTLLTTNVGRAFASASGSAGYNSSYSSPRRPRYVLLSGEIGGSSSLAWTTPGAMAGESLLGTLDGELHTRIGLGGDGTGGGGWGTDSSIRAVSQLYGADGTLHVRRGLGGDGSGGGGGGLDSSIRGVSAWDTDPGLRFRDSVGNLWDWRGRWLSKGNTPAALQTAHGAITQIFVEHISSTLDSHNLFSDSPQRTATPTPHANVCEGQGADSGILLCLLAALGDIELDPVWNAHPPALELRSASSPGTIYGRLVQSDDSSLYSWIGAGPARFAVSYALVGWYVQMYNPGADHSCTIYRNSSPVYGQPANAFMRRVKNAGGTPTLDGDGIALEFNPSMEAWTLTSGISRTVFVVAEAT
jgi:hypothetical protein